MSLWKEQNTKYMKRQREEGSRADYLHVYKEEQKMFDVREQVGGCCYILKVI